VKFKNAFERQLFEGALRACDGAVSIEHNKTITIEDASALEVSSFVGPPRKEIDVITAGFSQSPDLKILISGKDYAARAEPAQVQEWGAVVRTMNRYSAGTEYIGLVVCRSGFTSGCEPWAASENLGLIPPLKGKSLSFAAETVSQMFERVLRALGRRLHFPHDDLFTPPEFYDFTYRLTEAFEGRDEALKEGSRYQLLGTGWLSSFGDLVKMVRNKTLERIVVTNAGVFLRFSDGFSFRMLGKQLQFGADDGEIRGEPASIRCEKNFVPPQACSFDFLSGLVIGQRVTSAGDWGDRFEFGLTDDLMLAIEPDHLQVYRTRNPVDQNLL